MARTSAKKEDLPPPAEAPPEKESPAHGILSSITSGLFGGWRDRLVHGVGRPLAGGFIAGVALAVALGIALRDALFGLAALVVSPYSDSVRPFAQGLVTLVLVGAIAFLAVRIATRRRGHSPEPGKACPACLEPVPAAATKCRACGSDV